MLAGLVICWLLAAPSAADVAALHPGCVATADCFGVRLFVAEDGAGGAVVDRAWLAAQLAEAERHFAPSGIGFRVRSIEALPADARLVTTRADRDQLGRARFERGDVSVFVVARLDDVDAPGEIRGVHWRDRADRRRRWIIVSRIAPPRVLAHELGHFFGLPHTTAAASIMNKTPRATPPPAARSFTPRERRRIQARRDRMVRSGRLVRWH